MFQKFKTYIQQNNLFSAKDKLLLAVSGGVDSSALCELCYQGGYVFGIAHCNFSLRGADSDRDEKFVAGLAVKYNVPFYVTRFDTKKEAKLSKLSIQETARNLRYNWFEETREKQGYHHIVTAHHADDNIETVLMNFFRGTGIKGLKGIEPRYDHIIRPLLFARRKQLEEFLDVNGLEFVTDDSNQQDDYSRNFFRIHIIPLLEKIYPEVNQNILDNIGRFRDVELVYREAMEQHKKKLLEIRQGETHIPVLKLKKSFPLRTILYEIIKDFGFTSRQVGEVINLMEGETGKYISSHSHRIIKNRGWLIIAPVNNAESNYLIIDERIEKLESGIGNLSFRTFHDSSPSISDSKEIALLDADEIEFPLIMRKWKQGDYFYPLGLKKKKKLARFFIDQKLSKTEKEKIRVLEMNKKIIWVIGQRIDDRFKVTGKTKKILEIAIR